MSNPLEDLKLVEVNGSVETDPAFTGHLLVDMPNRPTVAVPPWTAEDIKKAWDYAATKILGPRINAVLNALMSVEDGKSGADGIGVTAIPGISGATVQAVFESMKQAMDDIVSGAVPDNSLTDAKLSKEPVDILARFAAHLVDYNKHIYGVATTTGTSSAYSIDVDGFDASVTSLIIIKPHVACLAAPTLSINGGAAHTIRPATGLSLAASQMLQDGLYFIVWVAGVAPIMRIINPEPATVPNALKVGGHTVFVQETQPTGAVAGDLWFW